MAKWGWLRVLLVTLALGAGCAGPTASDDAAGATDSAVADAATMPDALAVDAFTPADAPGVDAFTPPDAPALDGGGDATASMGTLVVAATGGTVASADGLFEIVIGPGALVADTTISITQLAAADVPIDVAALSPLSGVYSVEPDGLTFPEQGAYVHVVVPALPPGFVVAGAYPALFEASRPRDGGAIEQTPGLFTFYRADGGAEVVAPLAHLSLHTLPLGPQAANLVAELGDPTQYVPTPWDTTATEVRAPEPSPVAFVPITHMSLVGGVVTGSTIDMLDGPGGPPVVTFGSSLPSYLSTVRWNHSNLADFVAAAREVDIGSGTFAADLRTATPTRPQQFRFRCSSAGAGEIFVGMGVHYADPLPPAAPVGFDRLHPYVFVSQEFVCEDPSDIDAVCEQQQVCTRVGDRFSCSLSAPNCRVLTRPPSTIVLDTGVGTFVTVRPTGTLEPAGPPTITATNAGGATMTATRTATGTYDTAIDTPALWDARAVTTWTATGATAAVPTAPPDEIPFHFGPALGLDTDVVLDAPDDGAALLDVTIEAGPVRCGSIASGYVTIDSRPTPVDLGGGARGLDAPLRRAIESAATTCGITPSEITVTPWTVTLGTSTSATLPLPMTRVRVRTGSTQRYDGAAITATCPAAQTFCTDRCVDTTRDPLNCGGCGMTPIELCNGLNDDCDGAVDEGCPSSIFMYSGDNQVSPHFGDSTTPAGTVNTVTCINALIGLCGSLNPDGSIRQIRAVCGATTLRRDTSTTPYTFAIDVRELAPGTCETATSGGGWTGGLNPWAIRCPAGMVADGIQGQETGNIEQLALHCSQWTAVQNVTGLWVIGRGAQAMTAFAGTGTGTPFSWMIPDESVDMQPGVLRNLRDRYFAPVSGNSEVIDLYVTGRSAELR